MFRLSVALDPIQLAARTLRDATRDKSYRAYEMGQEAGAYLRWKRGHLTESSYKRYESVLDKLARHFPDLQMRDFEPPVGTDRVEEFLEDHWGSAAASTYNTALVVMRDFFKWAALKSKIHGDPTLPIRAHKIRDRHRESYSEADVAQILAAGPNDDFLHRDRCLLRLLLVYGLRRGAIQNIQFKHFDHERKQLTIFTKGGKVRSVPIPEPAFWNDLGRHIIEAQADPDHYLLPGSRMIPRGHDEETGEPIMLRKYFLERRISESGVHNWWYACLHRAGLVAKGVRSGSKMHKGRHTAGQRVLDKTGNLKAAQMLLGHASIQTTADIYTDWDIDQLAETMRQVTSDA